MDYCIYTNKHFRKDEMNIEHIIPKSLGGSDDFTIYVNKDANSQLGTSVDGSFINDFLVKMKQIHSNYLGHSKKPPYLRLKNCSIDGSPVNVTFSKGNLEVYDPINRRKLFGKNKIQMSTKINLDTRIKFVSKVALATGYFLYGDTFVKYADHKSLRKVIFSENLKEEQLNLRFYDNLHQVDEKDDLDIQMMRFLLKYLAGSCVVLCYSPRSLIVHVGIGGEFIGMVNFKANIKKFVKAEDYSLGRVLLCKDGKLTEKSFRQTLYDLNKDLGLVDLQGEI